ncbi:Pao retrotransposon peptidase [Nesidiocoris tenuis]|uniref:Pao retrotransposon peptidase n=1 Tax=Nesidiocoris tenuis TaxID=355587 RepID=A0ABN7BH59_9HEMI|nr:Pao retrotransposon peptidase [Nesidiocoris tenuis]
MSTIEDFSLPHHGVYRAGHPSTPLRIVWNASAPSSSKYTLNQLLHTGPKLQKDIFEILIHFRLFPYAITGDVRRMFLQILVHPNDRCFQRFIFRNDPSEQLSVYEIDSVVFGMTSSPYLAQAVVQSLAQQEKDRFPLASRTALQDMYIDDVTSSVENESLVIATYRELTAMFATAKFTLSKWCSNSPALMDLIAANNDQPASVDFGKAMATKVLGVHWSAADDILRFVNAAPVDRLCTKRNILSTVARTFDPLGLISPVTIIPKLMIKELWDNKIDWDEPAPARVEQMWESFCEQLRSLSDLKFPRHIGVTAESTCCLVGFSDSSSRAYGACVYLRTVAPNLGIQVQLLCAKSRIAPAKILSIPRLELCAALLLAKLMRFVLQSYNARCQFNRICAYTDSQVVLYWIRSDPAKWKTFVSNRISQLQENIAQENWGHVPGKENPADVLSRGIYPAELKTHPLWFHGPSWLHQNPDAWPQCSSLEFDVHATEAESKPIACYKVVTNAQSNPLTSLLDNISSYRKLLRSTAYVFRACSRQHLGVPFVQAIEIKKAELFWIRWVQSQSYENEIKLLEQGKPLVNTNPLLKLDPFVRQGILRVGGRLDKAAIGYDQKHPYLLPSKGKFIDMLIDQCHSDLLHAGPHLTMSRIHSRFWIPSLRARVRSRIRSCNVCFRTKPKPTQPKMASLPALRLQGFKAFRNVGLDFAGPFSITPYRQRGQRKLTKSYFCLFICLTVKAIHIELVSDLTTECFLAAFKRFLCRRGPCEELRSDGGLTFVGARRKLNELETLISSSSFAENVGGELAGRGITWKVNPPYGPNFGGIWESNIKCVKQHLSRIIGNQVLTYEEFNTVLIQIEAILNSRPLCVLSQDPSAPAALTPAHFLTLGSTLDEIPAEDVAEIPISRLQRYEQIDHIVQNFWKRWRTEFLHTLQLRSKWRLPTTPIEKGAVVVLSKDNYPPLKWPLGIVEKVFPGTDGVIRVVEIRTPSGVYRRPVNKVCPLPSQ